MPGTEPAMREALAGNRFWDAGVQEVFAREGEPRVDAILQNREEVVALCAFMAQHGVRSYLEIGVWTGALVRALHRIFRFDLVAACDQGYAATLGLPIVLPPGTVSFTGDSGSEEYRRFRRGLGPIDLVFIDGHHAYHAVKRDFEAERAEPHRFIALHDIAGGTRATAGVRKAWDEIRDGHKLELVRPHVELGLDHSTMGIGVWWG